MQILRDTCSVADYSEDNATLLLDRYYLSGPAILALAEHNKHEHRKSYVLMIVKARQTTTGFMQLHKEKNEVPKQGRPRKKAIKLFSGIYSKQKFRYLGRLQYDFMAKDEKSLTIVFTLYGIHDC